MRSTRADDPGLFEAPLNRSQPGLHTVDVNASTRISFDLSLLAAAALFAAGCVSDPYHPSGDDWGETSGNPGEGDGDGDPTTTTGDGDGDPTTTTTGDGDGDPTTTTGDGDGDPTTTGDGDGDPATTGEPDPEIPAFPDSDSWYRLKTQFEGASHCLESNDTDWSEWHGGNAFMDGCQEVSGQMWRFEPVISEGEVWYRMKSAFQGDDKCLEGNHPDELYQGGASFMADCQPNPDQLWRLVEAEGWFHLETQAQGAGTCLSGNYAEAPYKQGAAFMAECEPFTSQIFHVTTLGHYDPALCDPLGTVLGVQGLEGAFCSFECEDQADCPQGPEGTEGNCGLSAGDQLYCGLWCTPGLNQCPVGSTCKPFPGDEQNGMCTY